jgi:hypothetical protein
MRTYKNLSRKSFKIRTYKKHPGWGRGNLNLEYSQTQQVRKWAD